MSKKLLIPSLLTAGLVSLLIGVSPVFDKNKSSDDAKLIFGGITISFICFGLSGYLLWDNQQKQKLEKERVRYLRKIFLGLIDITNGKITALEFVSHAIRLGKIELSGDEATDFLKRMIKEFDGYRDVTDSGNVIYIFESSKSATPPPPNSTLPPPRPTQPKPTQSSAPTLPPPRPTQPKPTQSSAPTPPPPRPTQPKPTQSSAPTPSLDYTLLKVLEEHLVQGSWQKADEVTSRLMLKTVNQAISLNPDDIKDFPCNAIQEIDRLWQIYSNNQFGFLAQLEVFNSCFPNKSSIVLNSNNWRKYGSSLGWYVKGQWPNHHHDLNFSLDAPKGHLPFLPIWQGAWWGAFIDGQGERFHLLSQHAS